MTTQPHVTLSSDERKIGSQLINAMLTPTKSFMLYGLDEHVLSELETQNGIRHNTVTIYDGDTLEYSVGTVVDFDELVKTANQNPDMGVVSLRDEFMTDVDDCLQEDYLIALDAYNLAELKDAIINTLILLNINKETADQDIQRVTQSLAKMTSIPNLSILHLNACFAVNNTDPTVTTISLGLDKHAYLLVKLHIALLGQDQSTHAEIPLNLYEIAEKLL